MVEILVQDMKTVIGELKQGMKAAEEAEDDTTSDMLMAIHTSLEKHHWMLSSFLA